METGFAPRFAEDVLGSFASSGLFAQEALRTPRGCDPLPELSAISLSRDPVKGTFVNHTHGFRRRCWWIGRRF